MQSKTSTKWLLFTAGVIGIAFSMTIVFLLTDGLSNKDSSSKSLLLTKSQTTRKFVEVKPIEFIQGDVLLASDKLGLPVNLRIPKININTNLLGVGLTSQGAVDSPKMPGNAAWFNFSPRPGENGNSIIVGHYGWKNGVPAVFDNLNKLRKGDKIYVRDEKGVTSVFIVSSSRNYEQKADTTEVFSSKDGKSHLNLITCGGVWNKADKSYSKRLVVFADKV